MPLINLPDGRQIDISKKDIDTYFGEIWIGTMTPEELVRTLRYQDDVRNDGLSYVYKPEAL